MSVNHHSCIHCYKKLTPFSTVISLFGGVFRGNSEMEDEKTNRESSISTITLSKVDPYPNDLDISDFESREQEKRDKEPLFFCVWIVNRPGLIFGKILLFYSWVAIL